jgi:hypothetical protein
MAFALQVDKLDSDGAIHVRHVFFAESAEECEQLRDQHGDGCRAFGPALINGRVIETLEEIEEIPEWRET